MEQLQRRYDIDWLRVIAIGLLLVYHISIVFQPWGVFIGFIQSSRSMEGLWKPMSMLNVWRIPLLFYISGMGLAFASRKRNLPALLAERSRRILLPFLFGMVAIVPWHLMLWQKYYSQEIRYMVHPSHLWFLANIFAYVLICAPLLKWLSGSRKVRLFLEKTYRNPAGLLLVLVPFVLESILMDPDSYPSFAMTWHGFFTGLLAFVFGCSFIISRQTLWLNVKRWKWLYAAMALVLYLYRLLFGNLEAPHFMVAIESNLWIFAVLGTGYSYLNRPHRILTYLSEAAYPVYILHMFFLYLGSVIILPLEIAVALKFVLIVLFTFSGSLVVYECIIRRIRICRVLFGLKVQRRVAGSGIRDSLQPGGLYVP